jgi:predicted thioesterase
MRTGLEPGMSFTTTEGRETAESIRTLGGATPTLLLADLAGTMERTARKWLTDFCEGDEQSVGVYVCIERPDTIPDAHQITATATLRRIDGRRYTFDITAVNEHGVTVAAGEHERRIILRRRYKSGPSQRLEEGSL